MEPILTIRDLDFHYGEIHALDHVNFDVYPGEIVAMIGSNGAGKTTLLRTISGLLGKTQAEPYLLWVKELILCLPTKFLA